MAGMTSPPQATPQLPGKYPPFTLLYPWLTILVVVFLTVWLVGRLSVPHATAVRFNACVEKQIADNKKAAAPLTLQDVEKCESDEDKSFDELVKAPIDELKWLLEIIGTLAAFFVLVQGAAAFFSASAYTDQADKALAGIEKARESLQERYPIFNETQTRRSEASALLDRGIGAFSGAPGARTTEALRWDVKWKLYSSMPVSDRQYILSLESFVSIDIFPGPAGGELWSESLRRYAIFYQSKFEYENSIGMASFGDLERAESYLRKAVCLNRVDFTLQNDLGVLCLDIHKLVVARPGSARLPYDGRYRKEAIEQFRNSLALEPRQQRAHYNLSVVHTLYSTKEEDDLESARAELEKALRLKNWQYSPPVDAVKALLFYNLGCCEARVLAAKPSSGILSAAQEPVQQCLLHLREASHLGAGGIRAIENDTIKRDFGWDYPTAEARRKGDFVGLYEQADPEVKKQLEELKQDLLQKTM
jgi:hypothetical protein